MLRYKLFRWFAALVLLMGVLSGYLGIAMIGHRVVREAQTRVRLDLSSAWDVYRSHLREIETILKLTAARNVVTDFCEHQRWSDPQSAEEMRGTLRRTCLDFGLDFMAIVSPEGKVVLRPIPPFSIGDYRLGDPLVAEALAGRAASGAQILASEELRREGDGLAERAFFVLQPTERARPTPRTSEDRGMVMMAAVPVERNGRVIGVIYAGILLNRNHAFVDRVHDVVYGQETYEGESVGTVTVFLGDTRIATTVRLPNGNRAYGTRVSKEVAECVLDNGRSWGDRAFVVKDWYLTAYDPIRDPRGEVIGMLYVGIRERPFREMARSMIVRYSILAVVALIIALAIAFFVAGRVARPLHRLAEAARRVQHGEGFEPVPPDNSCAETTSLIVSFNEMAAALTDREKRLRETTDRLRAANESLTSLNRAYMETVEFVSHELKSPVAAILNYTYLLRRGLLGAVSEKQAEALGHVEASAKRLTEMIRHYLNLARIENQELVPIPTRVVLRDEIIVPAVEAMEADIAAAGVHVENLVPGNICLRCDVNMVREVFDNLLSNAVKYSRRGGRIRVESRPVGKMAECVVWNEGPGIPPEKMDKLFQKFVRLDDQPEKRSRGTGLGLFISKKIVEAHGGEMSAESRPGEWAAFRFTLPLDSGAAPSAEGAR